MFFVYNSSSLLRGGGPLAVEEIVLNSRFTGRTHRFAPTVGWFVGTRHAVSAKSPSASLVPLNQEGQFSPSAVFGRADPARTGAWFVGADRCVCPNSGSVEF